MLCCCAQLQALHVLFSTAEHAGLHSCWCCVQAPVLPRDSGTFHCSLPRLMPLSAIDPSLAIGFFCADIGGRGGALHGAADVQGLSCIALGLGGCLCWLGV